MSNKNYNPELAKYIGHWSNDMCGSDYICIDLYRNKMGEYFIYKQYGEYVTDIFYFEMITPMSFDDARKWAKAHIDTEEYRAEFIY